MFKKTLITLLVLSSSSGATQQITQKTAEKTYTETEVNQLKNNWLQIYHKEFQHVQQLRLKQRENFSQIINLINTASSQKRLSPALEQIIRGLRDTLSGYPLEMDADWAILNAKIKLDQVQEGEIQAFMTKYPKSVYIKQLQQLTFNRLYSAQKLTELVEYAQQVKPTGVAEQGKVYAARYELLAAQAQINPEAEQAAETNTKNNELEQLVREFDNFWLKTGQLPQETANLESYWRDQGFKTELKIKAKAIELVKLGLDNEITKLANNLASGALKSWLETVAELVKKPQDLQNFIKNQPLDSEFKDENKAILLQLFPKYMRTIAEDIKTPTFEQYQLWAEQYQLSPEELKTLKISFINRLFDNVEPTFQLWRDEQIKVLNTDNLIERRLRMAIWQKTDLNEWLALLSAEGKAKAEWRYWAAKVNKNQEQRKAVWETLTKERGFYPMLASQQLGKVYQLPAVAFSVLTEEQYNRYKAQFERIGELRQLERFHEAKSAWVAFLKELPQTEKLAAISYVKEQDWFDLAVEGTIQAKAFDYIDLRLPNAYSDWFDLNLKDKTISKTFAQAIARQESAWNAQAQSHAKAMGLMQMLPTTAEKTAKDNKLPFRNERDLLRPFNNIMLGTTHLAELNEKYPNNRILIASAYNAGAGRVERWLARSQGTLEMDEFIASIPYYETRGYVQNVLAYDYYYYSLYADDRQKQTKELKMFTKEELNKKY